MFPLTEEERIARIRSELAVSEEKAKAKRDSALAALDEATEKWTEAAVMLETFDVMTGIISAARAAAAVPDGVDPDTGEVQSATDDAVGKPDSEDFVTENVAGDGAASGDSKLVDAIRIVVDTGAASPSLLQRRLGIGYARAAALIDEMENRAIVSAFDGSKARAVLVGQDDLEAVLSCVTSGAFIGAAVEPAAELEICDTCGNGGACNVRQPEGSGVSGCDGSSWTRRAGETAA
jgi:DNA segregation ATPase FtsK/SpoIIIE-like protein